MENEPAASIYLRRKTKTATQYPIKWNHRASSIAGLTVFISFCVMNWILEWNNMVPQKTPVINHLLTTWVNLMFGGVLLLEAWYRYQYEKWQILQKIKLSPDWTYTILFVVLAIVLFCAGLVWLIDVEPSFVE